MRAPASAWTRRERAFFGVSALLFAASPAVTIVWCTSMSAMGQMPMPGGWTMSMAWMRMPGQTWPGAAASFLGMWIVMMVAMMLPSLVPMLWRYRQAVGRTGETRLAWLTALVGAGYFSKIDWTSAASPSMSGFNHGVLRIDAFSSYFTSTVPNIPASR
jgi:predicted metal-binding membrane protein